MSTLSETKKVLKDRELTATPLGQLALKLATAIDQAEPAALPNLGREFRLCMGEVLKGDVVEDGIGRLLESLAKPAG